MQKKTKLEDLIPHNKSMSLLNKLIDYDLEQGTLRADVTITKKTMFLTSQGVPSIIGIEYMAQTIAVYSGILDKTYGRKSKIGLLLGARQYKTDIPYFLLNEQLIIQCQEVHIEESGLAIFNCKIKNQQDKLLATSRLNVYHSDFLPT